MTDTTKIQWTDHTFSPWWGCARVSPACRSCYADTLATRWGHELWRRHGDRRMLSDETWRKPLKWNRDAERAGTPARVFCASMADVFEDHPQVAEPRKRLWDLIESTPWLHWQLLTKRIENVKTMAPWGDNWPDTVWLGTSVENQRWAETRIPILLSIPAHTRFLSCEPLLGHVDLRNLRLPDGRFLDALTGDVKTPEGDVYGCAPDTVSWVIGGGESGPRSRPTELGWLSSLIEQCEATGVAAFTKQVGTVAAKALGSADRKGGDPSYWPPELMVRQFPRAAVAVAS